MKYLVFAAEYYYPGGGVKDFKFHADSVAGAVDKLNERHEDGTLKYNHIEWFQVFDPSSCSVVAASADQSFPDAVHDESVVEYTHDEIGWRLLCS